jgi:hypothetical protein
MVMQPDLFNQSLGDNKKAIWEQAIEPIPIEKDNPDAGLLNLVPQTAILALTRQYGVRAIHIAKILDFLNQNEEKEIRREDISEKLAITLARMQGTINVMRKMGLITNRNQLTPFGKMLLQFNPRIDDIGILWIFHYLLASNANLLLWCHLFNGIFHKNEEIEISDITQEMAKLSGRWSEKSLKEKVPGEMSGILKAYTEGFLDRLGLIEKLDVGKYLCYSDTKIVPDLIWLASLLVYRDQYYPTAPSLEIPLIIEGNFSPGRILRQNEITARKAMDALHSSGLITVESRSGLDQVRFKRDITWLSAIAQHLESN